MKQFLIRSQLILVTVALFLTFVMTMAIVMRYNKRWDFTQEKIYSLSPPTENMLKELSEGVIEVLAFYPQDDPARNDLDIFMKECKMSHPHFKYGFYDPDRTPSLAKEYNIREPYSVMIRYNGRTEKVIRPDEESFTNALLKLARPKAYQLCFSVGHNEASVSEEGRNGFSSFAGSLRDANYSLNEILLSRDGVPESCDILILAGPHLLLEKDELELVDDAFKRGLGIFFLVDPMDPGTGEVFESFLAEYGIALGSDVIVDKMSRMVGGDFLVPLVSQYVAQHDITKKFDVATFYPVARSVQPSTKAQKRIEVLPLAFSGSGSWSETDLASLEKGEASFDMESDLQGPISVAVAAEDLQPERKGGNGGRMVVIGDSDFLTNAYVNMSGNRDFALNIMQWLARDERFITVRPRGGKFEPLLLSESEKLVVLAVSLGAFPLILFLSGAVQIFVRQRSS